MAEIKQRKMGRYCKAYPIERLREFSGWTEKSENVRPDPIVRDGSEAPVERRMSDVTFLYVQEDFTVTDGIHLEEFVIFDDVTPEWVAFCTDVLQFEIPAWITAQDVEVERADAAVGD